MSVDFKIGDLFATPGVQAFAHGCNCAGAMGKGIAVSFKQRWPKMYEEYRRRCKSGEFGLGDVFLWKEGGTFVFNLGTQRSWKTTAELWAIEQSLAEMVKMAEAEKIEVLALPRIGAGLGGLDWEDVKTRIIKIAENTRLRILVCEDFVPGKPLSDMVRQELS
jgi:O-acetyl-ADP-ribose deacetylase (regulator of RNase III)